MQSNRKARRTAKQLLQLCRVSGLLDDDRVRQTVQHVTAAGYRDGPGILAYFLRLVRLERAQHTAAIESAVPLPDDLRLAIEAGLKRRYGPGLITEFIHSSSLIGGVRIQVGSDVYDGSVRAGLAALEKSL